MSQELRDLAKKVMERVELAVNREDEAFKKALEFLREEIKTVLGEEGDDSVGEAQSPNPTVAAPIWGKMGGPQPASATSPNSAMREFGGDQSQYEDQKPGNGQPELEEGQEPSASIPNAQQPITGDMVDAIGNYGAAATSGLGAEMAQNPDPDVKPEESATKIEGDEKPEPTPDPVIVGGEGSVPDAGSDASGEPLPSEQAIAGADAGTAVQEQKDAEAMGDADSGPLSEASKSADNVDSSGGLPTGGNSPESTPLAPEGDAKESEEDSVEAPEDASNSPDSDASEGTAPKKRGRPKKNS